MPSRRHLLRALLAVGFFGGLLCQPSPVWAWDVQLHRMSLVPHAPLAGEPFEVVVELAYNGCQPKVDSVAIVGSSVFIQGFAGPPPNGGCGGVVVDRFELPVRVRGLAAGRYEIEATFRRLRDGEIADSLATSVQVRGAATEVPGLTPAGAILLLTALAWIGCRRLALSG